MALVSDLRAAIRALSSHRGFTAVAVSTLGGGLALAITILTVVNAYVVRGLPYPSAERLHRLDLATPNQPPPRGLEKLDWASLDDILESQIAWDLDVFYMLGGEFPESTPGAWVTPGYMEGFGVRVARGRSFAAADFQTGSPAVALISHRVWQMRFAADPDVLGRTFQAYVSDRPDEPEVFTIVGVLPQNLWHLNVYTEVLAPLKAQTYPYQVRLKPGVAVSTAARRIEALVRQGGTSLPADFRVVLTSTLDSYVGAIRPMLLAVTAASALVLIIAAANVAVLMLVRARRREKELAVRLALGASHLRLGRILVFEGLLVGTAATIVGLVIASLASARLGETVERSLDRRVPGGVDALNLDLPVILAACACGLLVTFVFTCIPLATAWRTTLSSGLASAGRGTTTAHAARSRGVLIGLELAASLTLIAGAALMTETGIRMLRLDFGIDGDDVITASLALRQRSFPDEASRAAFFDRLVNSAEGVAGSSVVALGDWWPLQGSRPRPVITSGTEPISATANPFSVTAPYFRAIGMTVVDGRAFTAQDRLGSEPVAIVSQTLAERLWPRRRAIDEQLTIELEPGQRAHARVVGVVNDVRQSHSDADLSDVYLPLMQRPGRFAFLYVRAPRASGWETDLRAAVARVDPEVALGAPRALTLGLEQERARPRFLAYLLSTFAVVAGMLALVGMHGVIAYAVRQRQREIAVRIAMGANRRSVATMFVRQGSVVLAAGLLAGVAGAVGLGRVLQSQLFGVMPDEPRLLGGAVVLFGLTAFAAMLWPAWRAASTDPVLVLKEE
jgi:predicted permease